MPDFNLSLDAIVPPGPSGNGAYFLKFTGGSPLYTPVLIDPVNDSVGEESPYSTIVFGTTIFKLLLNNNTDPGSIDMYSSVDDGVTWVKTPGPTFTNGTSAPSGFFGMYWDGSSPVVNVCYPIDGISGALQFVDFNLNTSTFTAPYGVGGPTAVTCPGLFTRSNGSLVAMYTETVSGHTRVFAAVYQGVWGTPVELSASVPITSDVGQPQFVFDSGTQIIHTFLPTTSAAPAFVQQAEVTSSLDTTVVNIAPAAIGNCLVVFVSSAESVPVSGITCTNTTFTKLVSGSLAEIWIGRVAGGASGATVTVQYQLLPVNHNIVKVAEYSGVAQFDGGASFDGTPQVFNAGANGPWVVPAGVTSIFVQAWGNGGDGGRNPNFAPIGQPPEPGGGGGGGGGYGEGTIAVTPGQTINIFVGGSTGYTGGVSYVDADPAIFGRKGQDGVYPNLGGAGGVGSTANGTNGADAPTQDGGNGGAGANGGGAGGNGGTISSPQGDGGTGPGGGAGGGYNTYSGGLGANGQVTITYAPNVQTAAYSSTGWDLLLACVGVLANASPTSQPAGYTALTTVTSAQVSLQANYEITPNNIPGGVQSAAWTYAAQNPFTTLIVGLKAASDVNYYVPFLSSNIAGSVSLFNNPLGTNTLPAFSFGLGSPNVLGGNTFVSIAIQTYDPVSLVKIPGVYRANVTAGTPFVLDTVDPNAVSDNSNVEAGQITPINGVNYLFWLTSDPGVSTGITRVYLSQNPNDGSGWSPRVLLFDAVADDPGGIDSVAGQTLTNQSSSLVITIPPAPPTPTPVPQGAQANVPTRPNITLLLKLPILAELNLLPNPYDICLLKDWRRYNRIDWNAVVGKNYLKPFAEEPWDEEGTPFGAITFNPSKSILLPNPALTDVVVFSFYVPVAYDGIILGQYHTYAGAGVFVEGSGDIVWRVRVNGRYPKDMGNMLTTQGSPKTLSAVAGGAFIHSHNFVEYLVSAPNTSGLLPLPGQGRILAGLHGYFYPRINQ